MNFLQILWKVSIDCLCLMRINKTSQKSIKMDDITSRLQYHNLVSVNWEIASSSKSKVTFNNLRVTAIQIEIVKENHDKVFSTSTHCIVCIRDATVTVVYRPTGHQWHRCTVSTGHDLFNSFRLSRLLKSKSSE